MASLSVAIMAVPERQASVSHLLTALNLAPEAVVWDRKHVGHLPTWWRAVQAASTSQPTHVLILEDDAVPAKDVLSAVQALIVKYPDRIFSLYTNSRAVDKARADGLNLSPSYHMQSDLAMVYPRLWLEQLWADYQPRADEFKGIGADDMRLKLRPQLTIWATVPSLVQHGQPFNSTLGHRYPRQIARWFIGTERSALSVDWSQS